jgi:hypothetical protein
MAKMMLRRMTSVDADDLLEPRTVTPITHLRITSQKCLLFQARFFVVSSSLLMVPVNFFQIFIQQLLPSHPFQPNEHDRYNVYNAIYILLNSRPHVSDLKRQKAIHATPEHSNGPHKPPSPLNLTPRWSLMIEDAGLHRDSGGLHGMCHIHQFIFSSIDGPFRIACC